MAVFDLAPPSPAVLAAAVQLSPVLGDSFGNLVRAAEAIDAAAAAGARLVVLPELCTSGYVFRDAAEARRYAEPADGAAVRGWCAQAAQHDLVVVAGFCELDADGSLRNSAAIIDASGLRAIYRKTHLWDREAEIFVRGDAPAPVVRTDLGRVGVAICYDAAFPEHARRLALGGADVVAVPMNSPAPAAATKPIPIELAIAMSTANANRVWIVQADRTGEERGVRWAQATVVVDPDGSIVGGPVDGPGTVLADVVVARARDKAWGERNDVLADRRPPLYAAPSPTEESGRR